MAITDTLLPIKSFKSGIQPALEIEAAVLVKTGVMGRNKVGRVKIEDKASSTDSCIEV